MALVVFGEKVDMLNIPSPEPGGFLVAYDLDGILKQKDENGVISIISGSSGTSTLSEVLLSGNNSGANAIVLDSSIISGTNKITLDNSAVSITTDNGFYSESYLFMTSESLLLANGSKSFRIEKDIYDQYNVISRYDVNNEQIIKNNSYQLNLNNKPVLEFTAGTTSISGSRLNSLISSDGSTINLGVINTVVLGGLGINANQSNSVYVPDLYIQDTKSIKGTKGSGKIQLNQYDDVVLSNNSNILGILSSTSSVTLTSNGILVRDTLNSTSTPNIDAGISYISTRNSNVNSGVVNTVIIGGQGLVATESNTVYLGNTVNINNQYKLPNIDGSNGQVLKTDGLGNTSWEYTISTLNTIGLTASGFKLLGGIYTPDTTYAISNADIDLYGGTKIYLTTNSDGILNENGIGKFYNPIYDKLTTGFGIWDISNTYIIGSKSIWGGYYWTNISGLVGTSTNIFTLSSSDWTKDTYLPNYQISYDIIKYDIINDLITYRSENNINIVSTNKADISYWLSINSLYNPIKSFQWGNIYDKVMDKGIGNQNITNSYNQNINFRGSKQINITFDNKSYQIDSIFKNNAYQTNIIFNNSYQSDIDFSNGSSQENLNFLNSSQILLKDSATYSQMDLIFENYQIDRDLIPFSSNESGLFIGSDVTIDGKLTVFGTASIINSQNLLVQDPIILLSGTQSGTPTLDSGIFINRGSSVTEAFIWDESMDEFSFISTNDNSSVIGNVNILNYSNIRANNAVLVGTVSSTAFKLLSGTNSQFLKGDGTVDTTTYTPTTRTITINGISYDLSSNSTWNVGTLTGTGTIGYIPKFSGTSIIGNSRLQDDSSGAITLTSLAGFNANMILNSSSNNAALVSYESNSILYYMAGLDAYQNYRINVHNGISTFVGLALYIPKATTRVIINDITDDGVSQFQVNGTAKITSSITANSFIKSGGLSSQFLKADGNVDSNTYQIAGSYVPYSGATASVYLGAYSITANNFVLNGTTGATGLYYSSSDKRVTLANYVANGIVRIETNGGQTAATFESNLDFIPYGNVAIGLTAATSKLHVFGASGSFTYQDTTQANGYVLTSDSNGVAKWIDPNPQKTITTNTILDDTYNNAIVKIKTSASITIPSTLMTNFNCVFRTFTGVTASFIAGSGTTMDAPYGMTLSTYKMATLFKDGSTTTYILEGELIT